MTREHLFFIPIIFSLGFVLGSLTAGGRPTPTSVPPPKVTVRGLLWPLAALVVLFIFTHVVAGHGGAKAVEEAMQGQPIFDQRASFAATEVYERIQAFGAAGRDAYKRMTYTTDLVFPCVLFTFLVQLARFVSERSTSSKWLRALTLALPAAWLLSDFVENAVVFHLLSDFPMQHAGPAGVLGIITSIKFTLLVASVATPAVVSAVGGRAVAS